VDATFTLTIQQLRERNIAAVLLAPDELPIDLLLSQPHRLPEPLATVAQDPLQRHETVAALFAAGLLTKDTGGTGRMHRLIQAVTQDHLPEAERKQHITDAVELMAELFPYEGGQPDRWPQCAQLLLHAQTLIDHAFAAQLGIHGLARLLTRVGIYLRRRGLDSRLARQMHERALAMYRRLYEGDSVYVANGLTIQLSTPRSRSVQRHAACRPTLALARLDLCTSLESQAAASGPRPDRSAGSPPRTPDRPRHIDPVD
jgi:hypothetical protein